MLNLKNKSEREEFLKNYKKWCTLYIGQDVSDLGLKFYIYEFENAAKVIVTECAVKGFDGKPYVDAQHNLIIPETDSYNPYGKTSGHSVREFYTYNLKGCGIGTIVDYITKNKGVI